MQQRGRTGKRKPGMHASRRWLDRIHPERVHLAVFAADRDVFAVAERVIAEAIASLVVLLRCLVVIEDPARVLGAARLVYEAAKLVVLALPEPPHAAMLAICAPQLGIDVSISVERGDEFIAVPLRTRRKVLGRARLSRMRLSTCGNCVMTVLSRGSDGEHPSMMNGSPAPRLTWLDAGE